MREYDLTDDLQPPVRKIRVLIVDDHVILRQALRLVLSQSPYIEVIADAGNGRESVLRSASAKPDVILMDILMPGLNGVEATRQILKQVPGSRVLILSAYSDDERVAQALQAGAAGYILKDSDVGQLIRAIRAIHAGNRYFSPGVAPALTADPHIASAPAQLTAREREVLQLLAEGASNRRIAEALVVSVKTVEAHRAHIMRKLQAHSDADLVRYAIQAGILGLDSAPPM